MNELTIKHTWTTANILPNSLETSIIDNEQISLTKLSWTPLHYIVYFGFKYSQAELLMANINIKDAEGFTPLLMAVRDGNYNDARILLDYGAEINIQNKSENTPLHIATRRKDEEMIKLLLERGADCTKVNKENLTPLMIAQSMSSNIIAELLLNAELKVFQNRCQNLCPK